MYPLKFDTIFKEKIWGGEKIHSHLGKDFSPLKNCGETWEISGVEGNISVVSNGDFKGKLLTDLVKEFGKQLLGQSVLERFGNEFPLLIKFLDAKEDLSIQVHPNDLLAEKRHKSKGKTEMWYIFQADEGATLISGFNQEVDKEIYLKKFREGNLMDILNKETVLEGDVFFIPAGRIHTIGAGIMLAEIQQTSDITYRLYDFDRKDDQGNFRELHTELALDAINFEFQKSFKTPYNNKENEEITLVNCPYFSTNKYQIDEEFKADFSTIDSFKIYICYKGKSLIKGNDFEVEMSKGEVILIPASIKKLSIFPLEKTEFLMTYIP